ncbi:MAG: hypothetical protein HRU09_20230 [Oligoflexales bacterium]|nr:hypothetical protein [Oligoflexales bacterium]
MKLLMLALFSMSSLVFAGGKGHFHPKRVAKCSGSCNAEQIKAATHAGISELIKWNKMEGKWDKANVDSVEKKTFKKPTKSLTAWVVTVSKNNEKTYVFFTEEGKVFRSNNTGTLK